MTKDGGSGRDDAQSEENGDEQDAADGDGVSTAANLDRKFKGGGGGGGGGSGSDGDESGGDSSSDDGGSGDDGRGGGGVPDDGGDYFQRPGGDGGSSDGGSGDGSDGDGGGSSGSGGGGSSDGDGSTPTPPRGPPTPPGDGTDDGGDDGGSSGGGTDDDTRTPPRGPPTPPSDSGGPPEFTLGEDHVDLLNFQPPANVRRRVQGDAGGHVQFIDDGASHLVNVDRYEVRLSGFEDHRSMDDVFEHLRLSFGEYFAAGGGEFFGYEDDDATEESQWRENPHGSVMVFDLHFWLNDVLDMLTAATSASNPVFGVTTNSPHHFGPVVATMSAGYEWTFSTARTANRGLHPIAGSRRFRLEPVGDEYRFVNEGVDRVSAMLYDLVRDAPELPDPTNLLPDFTPDFFELGHQAWMSFGRAMVDDVERRGGTAEIARTFSERYPWDEVRDRYWDG
jgi:hypothetical protein